MLSTSGKKKKFAKKTSTSSFIKKVGFSSSNHKSTKTLRTSFGGQQATLPNRYSVHSKNPFLASPSAANLRSTTSLKPDYYNNNNLVSSFADNNERVNINIDLSSHEEEQPFARQESDLTERMKQMSVYDLYKMTKKQDTVLIDAFIKKQIIGDSPGVAPQVKQNNYVIEEEKQEQKVEQHKKPAIYEEGALQETYADFKNKIKNSPRRTSITPE